MRLVWCAAIGLLLTVGRAAAQAVDIHMPSPDGKWVFEAKWHNDKPLGYTYDIKNAATGKVYCDSPPPKPDDLLPTRMNAVWSADSRYLAINIYLGRICFGTSVYFLSKSGPVEPQFPRGEEKEMILPADRKRWDGNGIVCTSVAPDAWDHDKLTITDGMKTELKNADGSTQSVSSTRSRVIQFTGKHGKIVSKSDPQY